MKLESSYETKMEPEKKRERMGAMCKDRSQAGTTGEIGFEFQQSMNSLRESAVTSMQVNTSKQPRGSTETMTQPMEDKEEEEGFAADFYRCGADWSSLLLSSDTSSGGNYCNNNNQQQPRFKQANLFQMWGLSNTTTTNSIPTKSAFSLAPDTIPTPTTKTCAQVISKQRPSVCPFYKKIPGTPFAVDAFKYGAIQGFRGYILSHFHADHYGGLTKAWSHGPIYCTPITAALLKICLYVDPQFIHPLELDREYVIEGIKVSLLEANHCPGAALIHFRLPTGQCVLHTGDFRASKLMHQYPLLNQRVNVVYLDTTYCNDKYRFPAKEDVLRFVVRVTQNCLRMQPKTLIVVGAYSIGKECVYIAISKALGVKIHADSRRRRILQSFGWPELSGSLTSDGKETPLHVLPISSLKFEVLERYLKTDTNRYTSVLAFRPTGWTYSESVGTRLDLIKPKSRGHISIYGVPYSEHSSFTELEEFIKFLKPGKVIPTVNVGNAAIRDKMQAYFREWLKP